jgi:hypothetical protein
MLAAPPSATLAPLARAQAQAVPMASVASATPAAAIVRNATHARTNQCVQPSPALAGEGGMREPEIAFAHHCERSEAIQKTRMRPVPRVVNTSSHPCLDCFAALAMTA